ncbi:hypothetical protein BHM03_00008748 [Ensete ventricosum]|nr:hypothetical protein BHM03_00008748 [Ensete ventricosum]
MQDAENKYMIGRKQLTYKWRPCERRHQPRRWPRLRHRAALRLQLGSFVQIATNVNKVEHRSVYEKLIPSVEEPTYIGRGAAAPRPRKMMKRHAPRGSHAARRTKGPSMQEIDRRRGFRRWTSKGRGPGLGFIGGGRRRPEGNRGSGVKGPAVGPTLDGTGSLFEPESDHVRIDQQRLRRCRRPVGRTKKASPSSDGRTLACHEQLVEAVAAARRKRLCKRRPRRPQPPRASSRTGDGDDRTEG